MIENYYIDNLAKNLLFWFVRYSKKCVAEIYTSLYGDAMFVLFGGADGGLKVTETPVIEFCYWNDKLIL